MDNLRLWEDVMSPLHNKPVVSSSRRRRLHVLDVHVLDVHVLDEGRLEVITEPAHIQDGERTVCNTCTHAPVHAQGHRGFMTAPWDQNTSS